MNTKSKKITLLFALLAVGIHLLSPVLSHGQKVFINHGNWDIPSNWSPYGVPVATDDVVINSAYNCTIPSGFMAECRMLQIGTNADLFIESSATLNIISAVATSPALSLGSGCTIVNSGDLSINGSGNTHVCLLSGGSTFTNQTAGTLVINKSSGTGSRALTIQGNFVNFGEIQVGNLSDPINGTGIEINGFLINHENADIIVHKSGSNYAGIFSTGSTNKFTNRGNCTLGTTTTSTVGIGFHVNSPILNDTSGVITILSSLSDGFFGSTFTFSNYGIIHVSNCTNIGLKTKFFNDNIGTININGCGTGIELSSNAESTNNGLLRLGNISTNSAKGFYLRNNADFVNYGTVECDRTYVGFTIENTGSVFSNSGVIHVGNSAPVTHVGFDILGSSQLINQVTGTIQINRTTGYSAMSVFNTATLSNFGTINIGNLNPVNLGIAMWSGSQTINQNGGTLNIRKNTGHGIWMLYSGTLLTNNGNIMIGNSTDQSQTGIRLEQGADLTNNASLEINNTAVQGIILTEIGTVFENYGSIQIGNISNVQSHGIDLYNNGTFINRVSGTMQINRTSFYWYSTAISFVSGTFDNYGTIDIGNLAHCSRGILYESTINNFAGGTITIDKINSTALISSASSSVFNNSGNIYIGQTIGCVDFGIDIWNNGSFVNNASGMIEINRVTTNWWSGGIKMTTAQFTNHGTIRLGNTGNLHYGIRVGENASQTASFTNHGTIEFDRITNSSNAAILCNPGSAFTNQSTGILKFGFNQPINIAFRGGGNVTNFGDILCKNILISNVFSGQTLHNKAGSLFHIFSGFTNYIDGTLIQATNAELKIDGTLQNFGTVNVTLE